MRRRRHGRGRHIRTRKLAAQKYGMALDERREVPGLLPHISTVGKALQFTPANGIPLRGNIADRLIEVERYIC